MRYFEFINALNPNNTSMTSSEGVLVSDMMHLSTKPLNGPFKTLLLEINKLACFGKSPSCFISYAWVSADVFPEQLWTQEFIYRLEVWLRLAGIETIIDRKNSRFGHHMRNFMKEGVNQSNFVLLIGTKALRAKLDSKDFYNVKVEYKFVFRRVLNELSQKKDQSVSPLIISGKGKAALPDKLFGKVAIEDFSGNDIQGGQINALIHHLQGLIAKLHSIDLTDKNNPITQKYVLLWENFIRQYILTRGNRVGNLAEENRPPFLYFQQVQRRQQLFGRQKFHMLHNFPENKGKTYIGRQDFIQLLSATIINNPKPNKSQITVISGLGGVGKTSLAKQIIFQIQAATNQASCSIFWFRVNDQINNSLYQEIIQQFGLNIGTNDYAIQQKWLFDWFTDHPGWILILDNVTNEEQIQSYLPPHGGNIIITSRSDQWKEELHLKKYDLELLPEAESCELLRQYIKDEDNDKVLELAKILGCLPLALVQAGGFIKNNKFLTIDDYIKLLKEQSSQTAQLYKENKNVWLTLSISLRLIKDNSLGSYELLILFSLFGNSDIPNDLLAQIAGYVNFLDFVSKVSPLVSYYIVHADKKNKTMSLHPLVSVIVFDELSQETKREKIERCLVAIKNILTKDSCDSKVIVAIIGLFLELTHKSDVLSNTIDAINEIIYAETLLVIVPILFKQDNMSALEYLVPRWKQLFESSIVTENRDLHFLLLEKLVGYRVKTRSDFPFLETGFQQFTNKFTSQELLPKIKLNQGRIAFELSKFDLAAEYLSAAVNSGALSIVDEVQARANLCAAYQQLKKPVVEVEQIAALGYVAVKKLPDPVDAIWQNTYIKAYVAECYVDNEKWQDAIQLRLENIAELETVTTRSNNRELSWNYWSLGNIEVLFGDLDKAKSYFDAFVNKMNKVFEELSKWPDKYKERFVELEEKINKRIKSDQFSPLGRLGL